MAAVASATSGANAIIENGKIVNQTTPEQKAEKERQDKATNNSTASKDQFLQLLVAQMKYQDPLQPTSNTEYISQYATLSSLEQMQNMSATMTMSRANEMAGKSVVIHHKETATGATQEIEGVVDYVTFENNKAKVYVGGSAYDVDEVYAVMDDSYTKKAELAESFTKSVNELPKLYDLKQSDAAKIENLANSYDQLDTTTKSLIDSNIVTTLMQYVTRCTDAGWIGAKASETKGTDSGTQPVAPTTDTTNTSDTTEAEKAVTPEEKKEENSTGEEEESIKGTDEPMNT
ncbi:MAG: hypothetical protein IJR00_03775 [Lachnospiraceae bacterium]|nr:hypothetical protein [Lachnospiraceae bacterium]